VTSKEGETTTWMQTDPYIELDNCVEVTTTTVKNGGEVRTTTTTTLIPMKMARERKEKDVEEAKDNGRHGEAMHGSTEEVENNGRHGEAMYGGMEEHSDLYDAW